MEIYDASSECQNFFLQVSLPAATLNNFPLYFSIIFFSIKSKKKGFGSIRKNFAFGKFFNRKSVPCATPTSIILSASIFLK